MALVEININIVNNVNEDDEECHEECDSDCCCDDDGVKGSLNFKLGPVTNKS